MTTTSWHDRAAALRIDARAFIDGKRVDARSGARFDCLSPVDGRKLAEAARSDGADVDAAVTSARAAFEDRRWAGKAPAERKKILVRFADLILADRDALALLETLDIGKPIRYSRSVDVQLAQNCIRDEVVRQANATPYGLAAGIWTADLSKAVRTSRALRAGTVHVNQYDNDDITVPFGGYKQSGNGRDKSLHAFDKYTELKTTWIQVG
jgi:acyl-CoA reductase-like NAD-dependent aldehyde dehydrogenase